MSYAEVAHIARVISAIRAAVESRHLLTLDSALNIFELAVRGDDYIRDRLAAVQAERALLAVSDVR